MKSRLLFPLTFIFTIGLAYYGSAQLFEQIGHELSSAGAGAASNIVKDVKAALITPSGTNATAGTATNKPGKSANSSAPSPDQDGRKPK